MQILLQPDKKNRAPDLRAIYDKAIAEAVELFIVSAYLTDWKTTQAITDKCKELTFIIGKDFGLTRKKACRDVLKWLPEQYKSDFRAADCLSSNFHPKLILWKNSADQGYLLLGSSNLTQAAFSTNYEANVLLEISDLQYTNVKNWIYKIKQDCSPISEGWLEKYNEAKLPKSVNGKKKPLVTLKLPSGPEINEAIIQRRKQHKEFAKIKEDLRDRIEECASGILSNENFYDAMMTLWGRNIQARLQGKGFEIKGKQGDWQDVCKAISRILAAPREPATLDNIVREEIDRLAKTQNPNRGAWMSEMLCQYFPDLYPVYARPVRKWLQHNKYQSARGSSEGLRYIDLAQKLRQEINQNKSNEAQNLLELDHAIWKWYELQKRV